MARSRSRSASSFTDCADAAAQVESPDTELARLIREQREDQRQDRFGLRSTVLGDCLRGIGVILNDDLPRGRDRRANPDGQ
jgi:hypothetical protein